MQVMTALDDRSWAAFPEDGPWTLHREAIRWLPLAADLRAAAQAEVPALTHPGRIPPGRRVVRVVSTLVGAVLPWWLRKRRGRHSSPEAGRADL